MPKKTGKDEAAPEAGSGLVRAPGGRTLKAQLEKLPADRQEQLKRELELER